MIDKIRSWWRDRRPEPPEEVPHLEVECGLCGQIICYTCDDPFEHGLSCTGKRSDG